MTNTDGEVENSYRYDVFGNMREQQENVENAFKYAGEQQENVENAFKYAGEQLDQETEQYYLRARFYNPTIARFTQEDVYRGDGLNLYVYVVNNPLLWLDPSGYKKGCNNNDEKKFKKDDNLPDGMRDNLEIKLHNYMDELNEKVHQHLKTIKREDEVIDGVKTVAVGIIRDMEAKGSISQDIIEKLQNENTVFKGASRKILNNANMQLLDDDERYKDRTIKAPFHGYSFIDHAEEGVMASFEKALKDTNVKINPNDVNGTFYMIQSNGRGICSKCTSQIFDKTKLKGIFQKFTEHYPNLRIIAITSEDANIDVTQFETLAIELKGGKATNILRNKKDAEEYYKK